MQLQSIERRNSIDCNWVKKCNGMLQYNISFNASYCLKEDIYTL
jgi:hypothetical protein